MCNLIHVKSKSEFNFMNVPVHLMPLFSYHLMDFVMVLIYASFVSELAHQFNCASIEKKKRRHNQLMLIEITLIGTCISILHLEDGEAIESIGIKRIESGMSSWCSWKFEFFIEFVIIRTSVLCWLYWMLINSFSKRRKTERCGRGFGFFFFFRFVFSVCWT